MSALPMLRQKSRPMLRNYQLISEIGSGGFSTVYQAINIQNQKIVAIKEFNKDNLKTTGDTKRFQQEIDATSILDHPNIVRLTDFFYDNNNFYLVQEYCPGGDLFEYIIANGPLQEPVCANIFKQMLDAISYCHSFKVAHRDLKLENVLIDKFPHIKITDFGLCGFVDDQKLLSTFCGSPAYTSPECLCRVPYDGIKSDIWGLGVMLYVMATGRMPWDTHNQTVMMKQIMRGAYIPIDKGSSQLKYLIKRILKVNPNDRLTVDEILADPWLKYAAEYKTVNKIPLRPYNTFTHEDRSIAKMTDRSDGGLDGLLECGIFEPQGLSRNNSNDNFAHSEKKDDSSNTSSEQISLGSAMTPSLPNLLRGSLELSHGHTMIFAQSRHRIRIKPQSMRKQPVLRPIIEE